MPTLLDLAGVEIPKGLDGRSFKKQIFEPEVISKEFDVVYSQNQFGRMVRYDQFKYVRSVVYGITYEILLLDWNYLNNIFQRIYDLEYK